MPECSAFSGRESYVKMWQLGDSRGFFVTTLPAAQPMGSRARAARRGKPSNIKRAETTTDTRALAIDQSRAR